MTMDNTESLGRLAHDLNNRLAALMGQLELARLDAVDDVGVTLSLNSALHAARDLADSLTGLSRHGGPGARRARTLRDVVFGMGDLLRKVFGSTEIEFEEVGGKIPPSLLSAEGQLEMLVVSLITAGRFLFGCDRPLILSTGCVDAPDEAADTPALVALRLHDRGTTRSGILAGIYDEAVRDSEEAARLAPGCRTAFQIARDLGGSLHHDISTGHDTTITVYLPVTGNFDLPAPRPSPAVELPQAERQTGTIVLIEDDSIIRGFTRRTLELAGFQVVSAGNAEEAFELTATMDQAVDLLIIDLVLPGMHGGRLARQLADRLDQPPVLFVSGYDDEAIHHHRLLANDAELLHKPYDQATLVERVSRIISSSRR